MGEGGRTKNEEMKIEINPGQKLLRRGAGEVILFLKQVNCKAHNQGSPLSPCSVFQSLKGLSNVRI